MKRKDKPRKQKRPNPAAGLPGIEQMLSNAVGPMILRQALGNATISEIAVVSSVIPLILKIVRSAGKEGVEAVFDKLYPEGIEIEIGGPYPKWPIPADSPDAS